jgi:hypothetical protein
MYLDGFSDITNVDISEICIDKMRQLHAKTPMRWIVADVTDLSQFQVIGNFFVQKIGSANFSIQIKF